MHLVPTAPRRAAAAALLALALAGCRDLALPSPPTSPTVTDFTPHQAYAGQLIAVSGTGFDPAASANTVNFAFASARAEKWSGGSLLVRVPPDAGSGPITVTGTQGTSKPSSRSFAYRGLGQPRLLQIAATNAILQSPRAVYSVAGDVAIDSALYRGLAWAGKTGLTTPILAKGRSAADPTRGIVYYAVDAAGATPPRLHARNTAVTPSTVVFQNLPSLPDLILPLPSAGVVLTFHSTATTEQVASWDSVTLAPKLVPTSTGVDALTFAGAADVGDGRAVVAVNTFALTSELALLNGNAPLPTAGTLAAPVIVGLPGTAMFVDDMVTVGRSRATIVAAGINFNDHLAATALDDGNVAIFDLDGTPAHKLNADTRSPSSIGAIAASNVPQFAPLSGAPLGVAVATKTRDQVTVGIDLATGTLLWSVPGYDPTAATVDGTLAYVADSGDNDVWIVNLATGSRIARVNFDVGPGTTGGVGYAGTSAFVPATTGIDGDLIFATTTFPGVLDLDTASGVPSALSRTRNVATVAYAPGTRSVWIVANAATPSVEGYLDAAWTTPVLATLPVGGVPRISAARLKTLVVGHDLGLTFVDASGATPVVTTAAIPGAAAPGFLGLGFTPAGRVWTLVQRTSDTQLQLWSTASITTGGAPDATWTVPATASATAAAYLEDGLWIFGTDANTLPVATLFDANLALVKVVPTTGGFTTIDAVSPNGRLLVYRELNPKVPGFPVHFFQAIPAAGFPELGSMVFDARVEGFAFGSTGERLYVLTQLPDRIITVD